MTVCTREDRERFEHVLFGPQAAFSDSSAGRVRFEEPDRYRTCYHRDRDRIIHCKAFRRLSHKTQVFLAPQGDHYRTRLTHTLEVAQISRTIARDLALNEDLAEAIALGHDLGHTPFGHTGETALTLAIREHLGIASDDASTTGIYRHNTQSLRVVDVLEKDGRGLNLTAEVRDGILHHTGAQSPSTLEGCIVGLSDRIAYVNHDIDDAIRAGLISEADLPQDTHEILGSTHSSRITTLIEDIVVTSEDSDTIAMSPKVDRAFNKLRDYLFNTVYTSGPAKAEEPKADRLIGELFEYYLAHIDEIPDDIRCVAHEHPSETVCDEPECTAVVDFIAGMTDRYARTIYTQLFIPGSWREMH